jgi:hypothetical protein
MEYLNGDLMSEKFNQTTNGWGTFFYNYYNGFANADGVFTVQNMK